jgi:hypothetical protein
MSSTALRKTPTPPSILNPRKRPSPSNDQVAQPSKKLQLVDSRNAVSASAITDRLRNLFPDHNVQSIVSQNACCFNVYTVIITFQLLTLCLCSLARRLDCLLALHLSQSNRIKTKSSASLDAVVPPNTASPSCPFSLVWCLPKRRPWDLQWQVVERYSFRALTVRRRRLQSIPCLVPISIVKQRLTP